MNGYVEIMHKVVYFQIYVLNSKNKKILNLRYKENYRSPGPSKRPGWIKWLKDWDW